MAQQRTRKRTPVSKGIYRDKHNVSIIVSVAGMPREFRKDEQGRKYRTFTTEELKRERKRIDARESLKSQRAIATSHTLAADVTSYLKTLRGRTYDDAKNNLAHWLTAFETRDRHSLTAIELRQHAATWTCAASTYNHRRQALISLYRVLDGPSAPNPARELTKRQEVMGAPKALPYDVIRAALEKMPRSKTRARLKVMAYTGLPQMQISKLTEDDWQGDQLRVTPRRKGTGAAGRWIPLSPDAQAALKEFAELKAWGTFSRSSVYKSWKLVGPKGSNPYSLRHSWITELYKRSKGDLIAVQQLSIHSRLDQLQRYAAAALGERMTALVLPRKTPTSATKKTPKPSTKLHRQKSRVRGKM
jgi:integrase